MLGDTPTSAYHPPLFFDLWASQSTANAVSAVTNSMSTAPNQITTSAIPKPPIGQVSYNAIVKVFILRCFTSMGFTGQAISDQKEKAAQELPKVLWIA
jgi:hypothetical protein